MNNMEIIRVLSHTFGRGNSKNVSLCYFSVSRATPLFIPVFGLFVVLHSCFTHAQVLGIRLVHELYSFYNYTECNAFFFCSVVIIFALVGECYQINRKILNILRLPNGLIMGLDEWDFVKPFDIPGFSLDK